MENKAITVLCIDDEEPGLLVRKILLESAGYRVLTARSGKEGIGVFQSEPVDAVVLDYWMSGMNGVAVGRELKRLSPSTPVIMLSAFVSLPDEMLGVADAWIRKAEEDPQYLLSTLQELLERSSHSHKQAGGSAES